jgi:hypothetical protein
MRNVAAMATLSTAVVVAFALLMLAVSTRVFSRSAIR